MVADCGGGVFSFGFGVSSGTERNAAMIGEGKESEREVAGEALHIEPVPERHCCLYAYQAEDLCV